jgi:hypothetical protein
MKNIMKLASLLLASATVGFTSCIDEVTPQSSIATADQIESSSAALANASLGLPAQMVQGYLVYGKQVHETDMAYPQFMIAQTELLGDMYPEGTNSGYDWYRFYNTAPASGNMGDNSYFAYLPWFTLYKFVKSCNAIINMVDTTSANTQSLGYLGSAYAARAFCYYYLTVFYEPVENKYTDISKVKGLTVPIIDENTTEEQAKNNPRVTHEKMMAFIYSDLAKAEKYLAGYSPSNHRLPSLAVAYGIHAKALLWDEKYADAATYARKAIDASGATPMTEDQWTNPSTGFTTAVSSWMWYLTYSAETMGNLCNFTGWISGEADWGYSAVSRPSIDRSLYDHIGRNDFRKHVFLDPKKYDYYNYQTCRSTDYINDAPDYLSLKFRCAGGNYNDYATGGAVDVPIMRVEEMYLIEALAVGASQGVAAGEALLNSFMTTYRDVTYKYTGTDLRDFELEVLQQMRIEFWGEGNAFPVAKRLKPGVMQNYEGTNAPASIFKINCEGIKPNWTLVIPIDEIDANQALQGLNNPNPTQTIAYPSPVGQYSEPKSK